MRPTEEAIEAARLIMRTQIRAASDEYDQGARPVLDWYVAEQAKLTKRFSDETRRFRAKFDQRVRSAKEEFDRFKRYGPLQISAEIQPGGPYPTRSPGTSKIQPPSGSTTQEATSPS